MGLITIISIVLRSLILVLTQLYRFSVFGSINDIYNIVTIFETMQEEVNATRSLPSFLFTTNPTLSLRYPSHVFIACSNAIPTGEQALPPSVHQRGEASGIILQERVTTRLKLLVEPHRFPPLVRCLFNSFPQSYSSLRIDLKRISPELVATALRGHVPPQPSGRRGFV